MTIDKLDEWIRFQVGIKSEYFGSPAFYGGMNLQQNPREFASLLDYLDDYDIKDYLEIGLGSGGTFCTIGMYFKDQFESMTGLDNFSYGHDNTHIEQNIAVLRAFTDIKVKLIRGDSKDKKVTQNLGQYDCIFVDGDHSYEGVKHDFALANKHLRTNGVLIFHDISSSSCPGVGQFWNEIKNKQCEEFVFGHTCGIGVYVQE